MSQHHPYSCAPAHSAGLLAPFATMRATEGYCAKPARITAAFDRQVFLVHEQVEHVTAADREHSRASSAQHSRPCHLALVLASPEGTAGWVTAVAAVMAPMLLLTCTVAMW